MFFIDLNCFAMVIYFSLFIISKSVHVGVEKDNDERKEEVEEEPHVHHLHVGSLRQVVAYVDEHRSQHQHGSQVNSDNSLVKRVFYVRIDKLSLISTQTQLNFNLNLG